MNRTKTKRLLCLLLSLAMVFTLTSVPVFAEDTDGGTTVESTAGESTDSGSVGEETNAEETVASIDGTGYSTLEDAIEAAKSSSETSVTITLTSDVTTSATIEWSQASPSLTIDLNEHNITKTEDGTSGNVFDVFQGNFTLTGSGTVTNNNGNSAVRIKGSTDSTDSNYTVVTVDENVTLTAAYPMFVTPNSQHGYGVVVNIDGTLDASTCGFYVNGQMQDTTGNIPEVYINSTAKITSTASGSGDDMAGVYLAGYAKTTVADGAEITGCTGIEIRAGELTVNGGTITGTGSFTIAKNGNGTTSSGIGIAVVQHTTNLPVSVTVNDGTISGVYAVYEEDIEDDTSTSDISISLTGGEYTGTTASVTVTDSTEVTTSISGGTYLVGTSDSSTADTSVESYLSDGVTLSEDGTVTADTTEYAASVTSSDGETVTNYETLSEALSALQANETLTLLADVTNSADDSTLTISLKAGATLDGNGYTISGNVCVYINVNGGTVTNTNFSNIHNSSSKLSAIYATGAAAGEITITGCTFDSCDWDAIQITPVAGAVISITNNTFMNTSSEIIGKRYVHVQSKVNVDFTVTVTDNKFYDTDSLSDSSFDVYFYADTSKAELSGNYFEETASVCIYSGNYVADEDAILPLADESLENDVNPVAKISNGNIYYYTSLADAFAAASSGNTVTLLSDVTLSADIRIEDGQTITLDLGNYTLDCGSSYRLRLYHGNLTVKNGTITGSQPINVYGSYEDASDYSVLTVESTVSLSDVNYGICLFPAYVDNKTTNYGYGAVINMYGSITGSGVGIFVSGNLGNDTASVTAMASGNTSVINVYGTIDMTNQGIAMNGYAIVNIYDGASITGSEAVGLKRGVLNVSGGTLTATGDYVDPVSANYNGVENTGAAISVTSTYNYAGTIELNITGGTITSTNGNALYIGHSGSESSTTTYTTGLSVSVTGGDFSTSASSDDVATVYVAAVVDGDDESYTTSIISGGTYDSDVNDYTTSTYAAVATTAEDGTTVYTIVPVVEDAVAIVLASDGTYLGSTSSLSYISCLEDNCTVQLIADVSEKTFTLKENTVTLDLNGYDITCTESSSYPYSAIYVTGGSLTVIDSSVEDGEVGDSVLSTTKGNGAVFVTGGDVTIEAGNYISYSSSGQTVQISPAATSSTVTINNGTFTSVGYGMQVQAGTLNINGGTIASSVTAIDGDETTYTPSVRGAVLVRASTPENSDTNIIPYLNIEGGYFTSVYSGSGMIVYAVDKTTNASTDPVDFTNYISISGGYYDMNNYSVARYLKDGYEVATNSDESTSSTYPYVVQETEVASGSIGYGYAAIDTDGNVTAYVMGTYTELSGAIYRANKVYSELSSQTGYYAYVKLTATEDALSLTSSVGSSSTYPKLIIDLNGATISSTATVFQVGADSELILLDSAGTATVTSSIATAGTLRNAGGKLTVYGGTYINTDTVNPYSPVIYNANVSGGSAESATTIINGGTFESKGRAIHLNLGTAALNGGTYTAKALYYPTDSTTNTVSYPDGYGAFVTNTDSSTGTTYYTWVVKQIAAYIDSTPYGTIQSAVDAAQSGDTIKLCANATEDVVIPEGANVTLDLAGYTLTNVSSHTITNYGTLTITDSTASEDSCGTVDNVTHARAAVYNEMDAVCTILAGNFTRSKEASTSSSDNGGNSYYTILNHGTMTIGSKNGDNYISVSNTGLYSSMIENGWQNGAQNTNGNDSTMYIYGGTFTGGLYNVKNDDYGVLYIYGGTFSGTNNILSWNVLTIAGGSFASTNMGVYTGYGDATMDKGTTTITGGDFTSDGRILNIYNSAASYAVSGGTYSQEVAPEYCADGYTPTANDGGTYGVKKFYIGISTDAEGATESVPATIMSASDGVMYVKVSAANIGKYNESAYPTTSLTFTSTDADGSTEDGHNYIFAGWYSATDGTSTCTSFPTSDAYAKFVDADVLSVQCVITSGSEAAGDAGTNYWRFATSVDSLKYDSIGFKVYKTDGTEVTMTTKITVYYKLTVQSAGNKVIEPNNFSNTSQYVASGYYADTTNVESFTAQAYWTTQDGTTVYGQETTFASADCTYPKSE